MVEIKFEVTNEKARYYKLVLQKRYNTGGDAPLEKLCHLAVVREIAEQSRLEADEAERAWKESLEV